MIVRVWQSPGLNRIAVPVALVNAVDARRILDRSNSENRAEPPGYIGKPDPAYDLIIPVCTPQRGPHCPDLPAGEASTPLHPYGVPDKGVERSEGICTANLVANVDAIGHGVLFGLYMIFGHGGNAGIERPLFLNELRAQRIIVDKRLCDGVFKRAPESSSSVDSEFRSASSFLSIW